MTNTESKINSGAVQDAFHDAALNAMGLMGFHVWSTFEGSQYDTVGGRLAVLKKAVAKARSWGMKVPGLPRRASDRAEFAAWLVVAINEFARAHGIDASTDCGFCRDCGEPACSDGRRCYDCDRTAPIQVPMHKQFTFRMEDDEPLEIEDLGEFAVLNDLEPETLNAFGALAVGESVRLGGGAAPIVTITRAR